MDNPHSRQLVKLLQKIAEKRGIHETFITFLELSALTISNRYYLKQFKERENRYLEIANNLSKEEMDGFAQMLAALIEALKYEADSGKLHDVLGDIYHQLGLHNKWKAQFFTPMGICDMMGLLTVSNPPRGKHLMVNEPCAGSGAIILGFVNAMIRKELSWTRDLTVIATDSDLKCVHMAYLQFSLYGIPAIVTHGNTLTQEEWSRWFTPMYFIRL